MSQFWNTLEQIKKQADARNLLRAMEDKFEKVLSSDAATSEAVSDQSRGEFDLHPAATDQRNVVFSEFGAFELPPVGESSVTSAEDRERLNESSKKLFSKLNAAVGRVLQPENDSVTETVLDARNSSETATSIQPDSTATEPLTSLENDTAAEDFTDNTVNAAPPSLGDDLASKCDSVNVDETNCSTMPETDPVNFAKPLNEKGTHDSDIGKPGLDAINRDRLLSSDGENLRYAAKGLSDDSNSDRGNPMEELTKVKTQYAELYVEGEKLAKENGDLSQRNRELIKANAALRGALDESQQRLDKLTVAAEERTAHIATLEKAQKSLAQKESQLVQLNKQLDYVRNERDAAKSSTKQSAMIAIEGLQKEKADAIEKLSNLEVASQLRERELLQELDKLRDALSLANASMSSLQDQCNAEVGQLQEVVAQQRLALDEAEALAQLSSNPLVQELELLRKQIEQANIQADSAESRASILQRDKITAESKAAQACTSLERLQRAFDELSFEHSSLQARLAEQKEVPREKLVDASCQVELFKRAGTMDRSEQTELPSVSTVGTSSDIDTEAFGAPALEAQTSFDGRLLKQSSSSSFVLATPTSSSKNAHQFQSELAQVERQLMIQIDSLKSQLAIAQQQRDSFRSEVVTYSIKAREASESFEQAQIQLDEVERRHEKALILLGEKTEQLHEAQQDLHEAKEAYKEQLEELLLKMAQG